MLKNQVIVLITVPSIEVGKQIARELVESRLAACVNILPGITSLYRWQGEVTEDEEFLLFVKSKQALFERLVELVNRHHPYDLPEVIALPIIAGLEPYLTWIDEETI